MMTPPLSLANPTLPPLLQLMNPIQSPLLPPPTPTPLNPTPPNIRLQLPSLFSVPLPALCLTLPTSCNPFPPRACLNVTPSSFSHTNSHLVDISRVSCINPFPSAIFPPHLHLPTNTIPPPSRNFFSLIKFLL